MQARRPSACITGQLSQDDSQSVRKRSSPCAALVSLSWPPVMVRDAHFRLVDQQPAPIGTTVRQDLQVREVSQGASSELLI
jgi:hypothetical protein